MMETLVKATSYSLIGIDSLLDAMQEQIVRPLKILRYGPITASDRDPLHATRPRPKFILIIGNDGSGKKSVTEVLVNEIRKGKSTKSADTYYFHRNVKFLTFNSEIGDRKLIPNLRTQFDDARSLADGRDFTVLVIPYFVDYCPRDWTTVENPPPPRRRVPRSTVNVDFIAALSEELDRTSPGKILVIAHTSREDCIDTIISSKLDFSYMIPKPNPGVRAQLIVHFLEDCNAVFNSDIQFVVKATDGFLPAELKDLVANVALEAQSRLRYARRIAGQPEVDDTPIAVIKADFLLFIPRIPEDDPDVVEIGPQHANNNRYAVNAAQVGGRDDDDDDYDWEPPQIAPRPIQMAPIQLGDLARPQALIQGNNRVEQMVVDEDQLDPQHNPLNLPQPAPEVQEQNPAEEDRDDDSIDLASDSDSDYDNVPDIGDADSDDDLQG